MLCASFIFSSCEKSDPIGPGVEPILCILECKGIDNCYSYIMDDKDLWLYKTRSLYYNKQWRENSPEDYNSLKESVQHEPLGYENLRILCNVNGKTYQREENGEKIPSNSNYYNLLKQVTYKVWLSPTEKEEFTKDWTIEENGYDTHLDSHFYTVRISDGITITADKPLFGQEAGTDLSEHFSVEGPSMCLPKGTLQNFDFLFWYDTEERPERVKDFFVNDTWLQPKYAIRFADIPEEQYEDITLSIQLHVTYDDWKTYYDKQLAECPQKEEVISFTCKVQFGKVSDFEQRYDQYVDENSFVTSW